VKARLVLLALLLSGSASGGEEPTPTPITNRLIQPLVQVKYIGVASPGAKPESIDLIVEEDGGLSSLSHGPLRCQRLSPSQVGALTQQLGDAAVREALSSASGGGAPPRLIVIVHYVTRTFPPSQVPPAIRRLIESVDAAFSGAGCKAAVPTISPRLKP
jgi:hypothetical protein